MATNEETYDQPLAMTTTNMFQANHEDAYDSDVDEGPNAAAAFMANLSSTSATNSQVNEVHSNDNQIFDNVDYLESEMHQAEHYRLDAYQRRKNNSKTRLCFLNGVLIMLKQFVERTLIFDELEAEYEQCVLDNKNLTIEKKNLLIKNDCLIAECLEKDICSIVLTSDIVVPPSSNCLCEDLRSACDREHTKVLELEAEVLKQQKMVIESEKRNSHLQKNHIDLQLKFQNYKQCIDTSSASNAIFEINKLRQQLQGKDDTIRNLDAQINIMKVLNVGSTKGSCDQQALETDRIQLQDTITSLRIQLDGLKVEHVSLNKRYDELSKANTHSRTAYTEKLSAFTAENTKLKAQVTGTTSSGPSTSETPKVLAPGMYNLGSKYIPPPKRANWVKPTPLPKKSNVLSSEPPRPLNNVCAACNKSLVIANHTDCLVMCDGSVNVKPHQTKRFKCQPKKEWKPIKRVWKPISKPVANSKPQWKPTGRHFSLFEKYPLTRIMEPTDMPIELPPSASSSPQITMVSRASYHRKCLCYRRSKGRTVADSIAERLTRPTAYKFKTDCSIIPVWTDGLRVLVFLMEKREILGLHNRTELIEKTEIKQKNLMEAARTMLIFAKAPLFLWAEAVATGERNLNLHTSTSVGSLCYPTNDYDDVGKLKAKADIVQLAPKPNDLLSQNSTELELTDLQSGTQSRSAHCKRPEPLVSLYQIKGRRVVSMGLMDDESNRAGLRYEGEIHEFETVLVCMDSCTMSVNITLSFRSMDFSRFKLDEYGDVLKNKDRLVDERLCLRILLDTLKGKPFTWVCWYAMDSALIKAFADADMQDVMTLGEKVLWFRSHFYGHRIVSWFIQEAEKYCHLHTE
ncbi:hypothetical protein Tco_0876917 [Tanacetum coccineum]|uniref:Uncharacterized protein n=1 Tax=Tanacetum coccineum TaxID=301880 RepID=A0ABQ5BWD0_9ASTR